MTGLIADAGIGAAVALHGRRDSGSAVAPINASSHAVWGDQPAAIERVTARHTLPGLLINTAAGIWWALVFQTLFGGAIGRRGLPAAVIGGAATATLAYAVDYHLVPSRLTPGWELRISRRSLIMSFATMAAGLAAGAMLARRS